MLTEEESMNKLGLQAFSIGIIFAVSLMGSYYYYFNKPAKTQLNQNSAATFLQKKGYIVLSKAEYNKMKKKAVSKISSPKNTKNEVLNNKNSHNSTTIQSYRLQIVSGMTLGEISHILAEQKIIENEGQFQQYLTSHDYETRIQPGSYELTNKMDYVQIARTITR